MNEPYRKYLDRLETNPLAKAAFAKLFPRSYRMPVGYWNPRNVSAQLADSNAWIEENQFAQSQDVRGQIEGLIAVYRVIEGLKENDAPTYVLVKDFGSAIWKATMDDDTVLKDIKFATKAALICFPEDFTKEVTGVLCPFFAYSWFDGESLLRITGGQVASVDRKGILSVAFNIITPDGVSLMLAFDCSGGDTIKGFLSPSGDVEVVTPDANMPDFMTTGKFHHTMLKLGINIILGMSVLPQLIDGLVVERERSIKKNKVRNEICAPRYIGFKYKRVPRPNYNPGTHASPIMHRRNGHWTNQPYGPGRTLRKLIWIDECWVCVPDEEKTNGK